MTTVAATRMNVSAEHSTEWSGKLTLATMSAIYIGHGGQSAVQTNPAHKIVLGANVQIGCSTTSAMDSVKVIPAHVPHRIETLPGKALLMVYLDARHYDWQQVCRLSERWRRLRPALVSGQMLAEDIVRLRPKSVDWRALNIIRGMAEGRTLSEISAEVRLSPGRSTHLVSETLGAPPQSWRRWLRLREAVDLLVAGASVTAAAHAAGFADAAHFSRTCRRTLGLPPSALRNTRLENLQSAGACQ